MRAKTLTVLICVLVFGFNSLSAQQAATTPVTLIVTDPTGARVPHLQIRVVPTPDPAPKRETDEKGELSLDLKPGGYALFARLSGFKPLATHFEVRTTKELQTIPFLLQLALNSGPVEVVPNTSTADLTSLAYPYHDATGCPSGN